MKNSKISNAKFLSDEKLQLITGQIFVGHGVLIAYQIGLFKLFSRGPLSLNEIAISLNLKERAAQSLISCCCAHNFIDFIENKYNLSPLGETYLSENSPSYYGGVLDLLIQESEIMNYENIKNAIVTNKPQVNSGDAIFSENKGLSSTEAFIRSLYQKAFKPAFYWSKNIDLKNSKTLIDIGGGSGIHTIAACINNPHLSGIVCDRSCVIPHTKYYIQESSLEEKIDIKALDMWNDAFPKGDVYFFGDIFHDWDKKKCQFLATKAFEALPKKGKILIHEMLFNDEKTDSFLTAAYNMKMMTWTEGQQFSHSEIRELLELSGFSNIEIKKSLGNWSLITAEKL